MKTLKKDGTKNIDFDEWREGVKITSDEIKKAGKFPD